MSFVWQQNLTHVKSYFLEALWAFDKLESQRNFHTFCCFELFESFYFSSRGQLLHVHVVILTDISCCRCEVVVDPHLRKSSMLKLLGRSQLRENSHFDKIEKNILALDYYVSSQSVDRKQQFILLMQNSFIQAKVKCIVYQLNSEPFMFEKN